MEYRSSSVAKIFKISHETVRTWSREFAEYLSPTARPGHNKQRLFSDEDMAVLALVSERKKKGVTFADIHLSLKSGQRGQAPQIEPEDANQLVSKDRENKLTVQLERMQLELSQVHEALQAAKNELMQLQTVKDENIKLATQLHSTEAHYVELQERSEQRISELMKRVEAISKEVGEAYSQGFMKAAVIFTNPEERIRLRNSIVHGHEGEFEIDKSFEE